MKSDLTDLTVAIHRETEMAVLVSVDGNRAAAVWLPKSQIELHHGVGRSKTAVITLPQRLAEDKGLV